MLNEKNQNVPNKILRVALVSAIGTLVGAFFCSSLLIACAGIFSNTNFIPYTILSQVVAFVSILAAFMGGFVSSKISKQKGLLFGSLTGFIMFIIIVIVGLCLSETFTVTTLLRGIMIVIAGSIGGLIGVNQKKKRR